MGFISVIGGANCDISAALHSPFVANDSNPGAISMSYGGVARNIAHNLFLLGHSVQFISIFGGDIFGGMMYDDCKRIGMHLDMSYKKKDCRTGIYLCINNSVGDMIAAVADTDIINLIDETFLSERIDSLNSSDLVIADTNLSADALLYLLNNLSCPLMVDAVSTQKAQRIMSALKQTDKTLHTLKLNHKEALAVTGLSDTSVAAKQIADMGVDNVYITLGAEGVLCYSNQSTICLPPLAVEVVNTTGAGDAFLAGVAHAYQNGIAFPNTARYGLMAARAALMSAKPVNENIKQTFI